MANEYLNRRDQMFPRLTPAQVARVAAIGERRQVKAGEVLFRPGEQNSSFFVVVRGGLEIVRFQGEREAPITTHGPGEFTGEINMLSARRSLVRGPRRRGRRGHRRRPRPPAQRWSSATPS